MFTGPKRAAKMVRTVRRSAFDKDITERAKRSVSANVQSEPEPEAEKVYEGKELRDLCVKILINEEKQRRLEEAFE